MAAGRERKDHRILPTAPSTRPPESLTERYRKRRARSGDERERERERNRGEGREERRRVALGTSSSTLRPEEKRSHRGTKARREQGPKAYFRSFRSSATRLWREEGEGGERKETFDTSREFARYQLQELLKGLCSRKLSDRCEVALRENSASINEGESSPYTSTSFEFIS